MYLNDVKREILRTLRHEPLDQYQVSGSTGIPHFQVRAELQSLRRDRLVYQSILGSGESARIGWHLTARGLDVVYGQDQIELV